ncbi:hypothetical protein ACODTQ_03145, partial [Acinetobacter pittii]|uniref:hypothetical protein n=1 Tax=Acinetobacter pittii TaxID=48296 RepID=UPI003B5089EF
MNNVFREKNLTGFSAVFSQKSITFTNKPSVNTIPINGIINNRKIAKKENGCTGIIIFKSLTSYIFICTHYYRY